MRIKKTAIQTYEDTGTWLTYGPVVFEYAIHYKGFAASGTDLGALIGRCYEASLGTCSWNEAANPTL